MKPLTDNAYIKLLRTRQRHLEYELHMIRDLLAYRQRKKKRKRSNDEVTK